MIQSISSIKGSISDGWKINGRRNKNGLLILSIFKARIEAIKKALLNNNNNRINYLA